MSGIKSIEALMGSGSVLVMDDNMSVLNTATAMLRQLGYTVYMAVDGVEVLDKVKEMAVKGESLDVILLDLTVPGSIGGKEANEKIKMLSPSTKTIIFSGYANDPILIEYIDYNFDGVLAKPFTVEDIGNAVKNVIKK